MKPLKPADKDELNLFTMAQKYANENTARELMEALLWPNGPTCPHCKAAGSECKDVYKITPDAKSKTRKGVYCCAACRKQFTVTVGTVFESSHVPLTKWVMAVFILCSAKKSVSANQLHRMLGVTYKTAWFMAHRIRFAMGADLKNAKLLTGTVEADETFVGGKSDRRRRNSNKTIVAAIVERGGEVRARVLPTVTAKNVGRFLGDCVSKDAIVNTDEHGAYRAPLKQWKRHDRVVHSRFEYSRKLPDGTSAGINTCESFFSLIKRGVFGSWHSVSPEHLAKYAGEFEFRWNTRHETDGQRMANLIPMLAGKRLMYRQPKN